MLDRLEGIGKMLDRCQRFLQNFQNFRLLDIDIKSPIRSWTNLVSMLSYNIGQFTLIEQFTEPSPPDSTLGDVLRRTET